MWTLTSFPPKDGDSHSWTAMSGRENVLAAFTSPAVPQPSAAPPYHPLNRATHCCRCITV